MEHQRSSSDLIRYVCTKPKHLGPASGEGYTTVNDGVWAWCPVGHQAYHEWEKVGSPMPLELARHAWRSGKLSATKS